MSEPSNQDRPRSTRQPPKPLSRTRRAILEILALDYEPWDAEAVFDRLYEMGIVDKQARGHIKLTMAQMAKDGQIAAWEGGQYIVGGHP